MVAFQIVMIVVSFLVLAAHFLRAGSLLVVAGLLAILFFLLAVRRPSAARVAQVTLVVGALEWTRTLIDTSLARIDAGRPVVRLVMILGSVVLVTLASALAFQGRRLGRIWGLGGRGAPRK